MDQQQAAQGATACLGGCMMAFGVVALIVAVVVIVSAWKIFAKAGQPGWAAIIPIYNVIVLLQICGRPIWWIILFLIPIVSIVVSIIVYLDLAKAFGKSVGFGVGLILLPFVFMPILAFGDAQYVGPEGAGQQA
jgi:hypothetical protein